ncbi:putative bifunctional diguanylate cyclase/phosphodiesterase [Acidovorax sp. RAC01]|uniref:putative bifunctional diguanylate cyclase/phosphodiesterase n=1 Tax=Acidovorax sp. RAC01 TaxID=1842533 RepID=UPI00083E6E6B|nr:bifunctional diguanylate cyclase/phosphodiesterase [Acidovorax sp. RAC01]AOG24809.1 diguanylate cyclase domain protein [Acidovorax sp. RAC01]
MPLAERTLTVVCLSAAVLAFAASLWVADPALKVFLDNTSWTLAFWLSAFWAWRGWSAARSSEWRLHRGLLAFTLLLAVGQGVWNVQVALGWNPFPAPADALFLLGALLWTVTVIRATFARLSRERAYTAALDFGGAVLALLAFTLVIYLPSRGVGSWAVGLVLILYPAGFLAAAAVTALAVPTVGLRIGPAHALVLAGMLGYGMSWMQWNLMVIGSTLQPGMWFNASFSLSALALGWGARGLRFEATQDMAYRHQCDRFMNYVPLMSMTLAAITLVLLFVAPDGRTGMQALILACCLVVLLLAALRQTLVVSLLNRLRTAEAAVLRNEERLYQVAHFDALTGLPNRRYFDDALERAVADASRYAQAPDRRVALLLIDLDHFKSVNETYGHRVGDALLTEAAQRITRLLDGQGLVSRLANDQFTVMLLRPASRTVLAQLAATLVEGLAQPWELSGVGAQYMGASMGISLYPDDAASSMELVQHAHSALHATKSAGRGSYRFYIEEFTQITRSRLELRRNLYGALQGGEFTLVYQPQLNQQRQTVGAEALLRWSVDGRAVPPDEFIPLAEESGLIVPIGLWVFETACRQLAQWRAEGWQVPVMSVNVSTIQLREPGFVQTLLDTARREGVAPAGLVLEITESQLLDESLYAIALDLRNAGFVLSIDDFGTGHSSLVKLKRLPVGELKIDKEFVRDIVVDMNDREICAMVNALARTLGLEVVAEGVETEEQLQLLVKMGCQRFQGWLFAPALAPAQLAAQWLQKHPQG